MILDATPNMAVLTCTCDLAFVVITTHGSLVTLCRIFVDFLHIKVTNFTSFLFIYFIKTNLIPAACALS